jgi:DNA-binding NarL/FixJ family response regulator
LLNLAFQEGLQDKVIAQHIFVSERMVRHYWDRLQTALGMDGDELRRQGKNLRIITQIRAREVGLID